MKGIHRTVLLKYGLYSVRPALPESRSFQMVLEAPRCFQMFLDVSKCVQKFLEPESHRGPTLKHRPQHRAEDTESLERLRQRISINGERVSSCIVPLLTGTYAVGPCGGLNPSWQADSEQTHICDARNAAGSRYIDTVTNVNYGNLTHTRACSNKQPLNNQGTCPAAIARLEHRAKVPFYPFYYPGRTGNCLAHNPLCAPNSVWPKKFLRVGI
eukprot:jgi/Chrzof1/7390/Cz02g21300.t1